MPAVVETMAYAGAVPWHGLGTSVEDVMTADEAIVLAGLDWTVSKHSAAAVILGKGGDQPDVKYVRSDEHFMTVRDTDHRVLGAVGSRYTPFQNHEAFGFLDSVAGPDRDVRYHTAGSLKGGKCVWMLAEIKDLIIQPVEGDITKPYMLIANDHTGARNLRVLGTSVRVVCNNTLQMALGAGRGEGVAIRHVGNLEARIDEARKALGFVLNETEEFQELAKFLVHRDMPSAPFKDFLDSLIPLPVEGNPARAKRAREKVSALFESGPGTNIPGVEGTAWAALQAVTHYTTHDRSSRGGKDARLNSVWFGSGNDMDQRAIRLLTA